MTAQSVLALKLVIVMVYCTHYCTYNMCALCSRHLIIARLHRRALSEHHAKFVTVLDRFVESVHP